jgi:thioredoxin 1
MRLLLLISILALLVTSCANRRERETRNTPPPAAPAATNAVPVVQITDANYDEEIRSQKVVLILFWAAWSAPDRAIAPVIDAISKDYSGRVKTGKVNVDENPELARKFKIEGIPTVVVLKDGREKERVVGPTSKKEISDLLDKQLQ